MQRFPKRRIALACLLPALAVAQVSQSRYLYTAPDPAAKGGIRGRVVSPGKPLKAALALPPDEPRFVYKGAVTGGEASEFVFQGLPIGRYDLMLVFDDAFYEGLTLSRGENSLTSHDRDLIKEIVEKSEPFYNRKVIHRLEGVTGTRTGTARCLCTFVRTKGALGFLDGKMYTDHRRSFKLVLLEDVGPGWQVTKTREIFVIQVTPDTGKDVIAQSHNNALARVRVIDAVKDLGDLDLTSSRP